MAVLALAVKLIRGYSMKKLIMFSVIFIALILASVPVFACAFDLDCSIGSKCIKAPGSLYGICVGGSYPGNSNDRVPTYAPLDLSGKIGDTCSFDVDCGIGNICLKSSGSLYGVCVRNR